MRLKWCVSRLCALFYIIGRVYRWCLERPVAEFFIFMPNTRHQTGIITTPAMYIPTLVKQQHFLVCCTASVNTSVLFLPQVSPPTFPPLLDSHSNSHFLAIPVVVAMHRQTPQKKLLKRMDVQKTTTVSWCQTYTCLSKHLNRKQHFMLGMKLQTIKLKHMLNQ